MTTNTRIGNSKIRQTKPVGNSTHAERRPPSPSWGDNGSARVPTQIYKDNWEKIFGKK